MHPEAAATSTIEGWHGALTEISSLGEALCGAIEQDDLVAAIGAMMQLRRARTSVERIDVAKTAEGIDRVTLAALRCSLERTHEVHAVMDHWLTRELPNDTALLSSALGIAVLADQLLPAAWDFERDLVVLMGSELASVAHLLADVGQVRMLYVGDHELPPGVHRVASGPEAIAAIAGMTPVPPRQIAWRSVEAFDAELQTQLRDAVKKAIEEHAVTRNTRTAFARKWISQGASNLAAIAKSPTVRDVRDAFAGKPFVIVAPGPSLANNIDQLKELAGKAVIACVSHALAPVLAAGVTPDLVISIDPDDCAYHFANCDVSASYLVNGATVHPALYALGARGILSFAANGDTDSWIYEGFTQLPVVPGGGSVTTTALSLALQWKCDPIVFLGLDLSFSNNQYYVATSVDGNARTQLRPDGTVELVGLSEGFHAMLKKDSPGAPPEETFELAGYHGGTVPSNFSLSLFHRWFEERLSLGVDATVYNCTEGGAFIKGASHRPFADVRAEITTTIDVAAALDPIMCTDVVGRTATMAKHIASITARLERVRRLATHANVLINRGASERELQRAERTLVRALEPLPFASLLAQKEVERAFSVAAHESDARGYLAASATLFGQLVNVCDYLLPVMIEAHANLATGRDHGDA